LTRFIKQNNGTQIDHPRSLLLRAEVVEEDGLGLLVVAEVTHDRAAAADDLNSLALLVVLAESAPLSEKLLVGNLHERDLVLLAESLDELDVHGLLAVLSQHGEMGLALVERLGSLVKALSESIGEVSGAQGGLEGRLHVHHCRSGGGGSNHGGGGALISSFRHVCRNPRWGLKKV
ncbi:hypothetical protein PMAYCL1PPCAC_14696, partial [Pristionchus mayeri]